MSNHFSNEDDTAAVNSQTGSNHPELNHKNRQLFWKLFKSTFKLSAFTFGGGYVIVPLMQKYFVEELSWIDEDEMLDLVSISQSAPGPIAINTSIIIGYRIAGVLGAIIATFGTVLPPLVIIAIISVFYIAFRENLWVQTILIGMQAGVAAIIINVVWDMVSKLIQTKNKMQLIMLFVSFILVFILDINLVWLLALSALVGGLTTFVNASRVKGGDQS